MVGGVNIVIAFLLKAARARERLHLLQRRVKTGRETNFLVLLISGSLVFNTLTAVLLIACVTSCAALFLDSCDSVASHGWRPCEKCQVCECLPLG